MKNKSILDYPMITKAELEEALLTANKQTRMAVTEFGDKFKNIYSTDNFYNQALNNQWTNGFWTGELWLAYECTKESIFKDTALSHVESFHQRIIKQIETDTHDLGFLYTPSCVAADKLLGCPKGQEAALMAADNLLSRFRQKGQFLQAWGKLSEPGNYRLIIDCLLNLPLLYWASGITGKPSYAQAADAHTGTALKVLIREDYSTYHTYYFNPENGKPLYGKTHQGYSAESAWARGQAWGIYGLALGYKYTKEPSYLQLFRQVTDYFLNHLPVDLIPYWDLIFTTGSNEPRDSSAAAIAVCGMLEMASYLPADEGTYYEGVARRLIKILYQSCSVKCPEVSNGQLLHGVYGKRTAFNDCIDHGIDECNLWGDYFYVEALVRLTREWVSYW